MIIQLDKEWKTQDVEEEFSLFFPYLKIKLEPIGELNSVKKTNNIEINGSMRMADVRELFTNELQMFPVFLRKKNVEWVDISKDNVLTLKEENEIGRQESEQFDETRFENFLEREF